VTGIEKAGEGESGQSTGTRWYRCQIYQSVFHQFTALKQLYSAWGEIYEVFGTGSDYGWALDDAAEREEDQHKPDTRYYIVTTLQHRLSSFLGVSAIGDLRLYVDRGQRPHPRPGHTRANAACDTVISALASRLDWRGDDLDDVATWVLTRLSKHKHKEFLHSSGRFHQYLPDLVKAIEDVLRSLIPEFEVPYIYTYKRDYISYFNPVRVLNFSVRMNFGVFTF